MPGKQFGNPVDEHAHLVAQVAVGRVHHINRSGLGAPARKQRLQRAAADVVLDQETHRMQHAQPGERGGHAGIRVVDRELVASAGLDHLAVLVHVENVGLAVASGHIAD